MNQEQWEPIERIIADLSTADKLEVIDRIARSIPEASPEDRDRAEWQRENRARLREELARLPVENDEVWSNRDHDRILYGGSS